MYGEVEYYIAHKYIEQDRLFAYVRKLNYNTDNYGQIYFTHFSSYQFIKSLELIDVQNFLIQVITNIFQIERECKIYFIDIDNFIRCKINVR